MAELIQPQTGQPNRENQGPRQPSQPFAAPPPFDTGGGWGEQSSGWFRRNASSVLLPLIALLVLGGGVYFYTRARQPIRPIVEFQEGATTSQTVTPGASPEVSTLITLSPEGKPILGGPEITVASGQIKVRPARGEGLTHLARKATKEYLSRANPGYTVTKEHKIFVEDFLKDAQLVKRQNNKILQEGEEVVFSEELLGQAMDQASKLSESQLKNLQQFSSKVVGL